jgi:hypothetical protein
MVDLEADSVWRVRQLALHLMTVGATLLILAVLTVPARHAFEQRAEVQAAPRLAFTPSHVAPAPHPCRVFGVYVDPWHVDDWALAIGASPQAVAKFEAFSSRRTLSGYVAESRRQGISRLMVSWEPWAPVPSALGVVEQARPQPGYRNIDIARGVQDRYISRFARELAHFPGTVYLRYGHEMNGYWYPWSRDPRAYRWAWRRVVKLFDIAGARNVRFVWSVNANLYESAAAWHTTMRKYWPGSRYVDFVGTTMIDFGGTKNYPVSRFAPRLRALRELYRKPVMLAETNTEANGAAAWLRDLRSVLRRSPWIQGVFWSQLPSRGKVQQRGTGIVDWDVERHPAAAAQLSAIIRDGIR